MNTNIGNHQMSILKLSWRNPLVLIVCFLLIVSIRFNRNDLVIKRPLNDAAYYIANVQQIRGEEPTYAFKGPFNERLLVTTLAAVLPFEPLTAINLANIFFLLIAIYCLFQLLSFLNLPERNLWIGVYLFVISFPTFYYSTIGYTDPGVLSMIFIGIYSLYSGKHFLFLLAMTCGTVAKENIVMLIPVALAFGYSRSDKKWYITALISALLFTVISAWVKHNIADQINTSFYWKPTLSRAFYNLARPNLYISSVLSFGIPGFLCLLFLVKKKLSVFEYWKQDLPLIIGLLVTFPPWIYMIPSAFPDGRAFWIASCFPIALSMVWWNRYGNPFLKQQTME
jgi:hypothetical protein